MFILAYTNRYTGKPIYAKIENTRISLMRVKIHIGEVADKMCFGKQEATKMGMVLACHMLEVATKDVEPTSWAIEPRLEWAKGN
jgi:hypothetical protein